MVLTHLRTDLLAEREDLSLGDGDPEPLPGLPGEGRGRQAEEPHGLLSQLIEALNERFGAGLGDADLIWFEQQQVELGSDSDVQAVARHNDEQQFAVFLKPRIEQAIVDRHQANGELFESYFASDERRELIDEYLVKSLYEDIRRRAAG